MEQKCIMAMTKKSIFKLEIDKKLTLIVLHISSPENQNVVTSFFFFFFHFLR